MQNELNKYYISLIRKKFSTATKSEKAHYLDEAEFFTKLSGKRIIKKLNEKRKGERTSFSKGCPLGFDDLIPHLRLLKNLMGNISEKRIKAAIPIWLPYY